MDIAEKFTELKKAKRMAFMPFVVAGDPNFKDSLKIAKLLAGHADFLELGFPYSDPLADGPTIQKADMRALKSGMNTDRVFKYIKAVRKFTNIPITVLVYANLIHQRGLNRFYQDAAKAGINGILVPDLPFEEAEEFIKAAKKFKIDPIFLVSQTTTNQRLKKILKSAQGFLYLVSVLGTTGARTKISYNTVKLIRTVKNQTRLPVAVGFGVSLPEHIRVLRQSGADGAIVGSALIDLIEKNSNKKDLAKKVVNYINSLGI